MSNPILEIDDLSSGYKELVVIKGISFDISEGNAVCLTGRNGVGKTTLMKVISGSLPIFSGQIKFNGDDIGQLPEYKRHALGLSSAPQEKIVFDNLTVKENLTLHYKDVDLDRYNVLFDKFPRISERLEQRAGTLSGGEKKLLSFVRVITEPTGLVLLDEPTEGVQAENIDLMKGIICDEKAEGRGFLIVDQNLPFLEGIADVTHLIDHGEQIYKIEGQQFRSEISKRMRI